MDEGLINKNRYRSFRKLSLMTLNLCLSAFYFGYSLAYFGSFDFKDFYRVFNGTMDQNIAQSLLQGCIPIGGGIGAASSSLLLKYFSRRNSLLVVNTLAIIVGFLLLIQSFELLFFTRFAQGLCTGFYTALSPLLIKQFAPTEISGTLGAFNQCFIAFGVFFGYCLELILIQIKPNFGDHWRILFGFPLITVVIQTILLLFVYKYQTPKYLLEKEREQECITVLKYIYKDEYLQEALEEKKNDVKGMSKSSIVSSEETELDEEKAKPRKNYLRIFIAIELSVLQQFVGINTVVANGQLIASKVLPDIANIIPVVLNLEQVLTSLATSYLLTRLGRKTILQAGTIGGVASLLFISVGFFLQNSLETFANILIIIGLVVFLANFGLSLGPIVWLYIPEIVQPDIVPFSTMANWISTSIVMILFPYLSNALPNPAPLFLFFAVWCTVFFFVNQKYVIETKGKTQTEIYDEYEQIHKS